jgi:hypothetical protein
MIFHEEIKKVPDVLYGSYSGSFLPVGSTVWIGCRVTFHRDATTGFYYKFKYQKWEDIKTTINEAEVHLGLSEPDQLRFHPTNEEDVIYCEPSEWWLDPIRFTLLTVLLREAKNNLRNSLDAGYFLSLTKAAAERFLDGAVFYHGDKFDGWLNEFMRTENLTKLQKTPSANETVRVCHHIGWDYHPMKLMKR